MEEENKNSQETFTVKKTEELKTEIDQYGVAILLDSSVLFSMTYENDSHHKVVTAAIECIKALSPKIYVLVPTITYLEVMSNLIRKKIPATKAGAMISKALKGTNFYTGGNLTTDEILKRYKQFSSAKFKDLKPNDFWIVVESIGLGAMLLTCDYEMFELTSKKYEDTYFLPNTNAKKGSDLPRLIESILLKIKK